MGLVSDLSSSQKPLDKRFKDTSQAPVNHDGVLQPAGFPDLPAGWRSETETFLSSDGKCRLFASYYTKENPSRSQPLRVLVVLHGLGEHGGRYRHFPHYLQNDVDLVYCLDHRGHGRSEGLKGYVERFDLFAEDVAHAIKRLHEKLTNEKKSPFQIDLFAHSLGGLIGLRTLFLFPQLPLTRASVSAPLLGIKVKVPAFKKYPAYVLAKVWPTIQMTSEVNPKHVSRDPNVQVAYQKDRLVHAKVTPKLFTELEWAMRDTLNRKETIPIPVQLQIPMGDLIVDPDVSIQFYEKITQPKKRLKTYSGFYHEPFNDIGKEQPFSDLADWLKGA